MRESNNFKRGDIFFVNIPELDYKHLQRPSFIMEGNHMHVVLHDSDHCGYDQRQVIVAPISEVSGAKANGKLLPSHIFLKKDSYDFIKKDCYICTHQSVPINRAWLLGKTPKGSLKKKHIKKMDLGLLHSLGLLDTLIDFTDLALSKKESEIKPPNTEKIDDFVFLLSDFKKRKKGKKSIYK